VTAALMTLILGRNAVIGARWDAADGMGILDVWSAEQILEEKQFLVALLRELHAEAVGARRVREATAALEVSNRLDRARMHLDAPTVDFGAVREHLEAALQAIESAR
jgi:hypothetical protein